MERIPFVPRRGVFSLEQRGLGFASPPKVLFFPEFETAQQLNDTYFRACWYFKPVVGEVDRIEFLTRDIELPAAPPPYFCEEAGRYDSAFRKVCRFSIARQSGAMENAMRKADIVMVWDSRCWDPPNALRQHQVFRRGGVVFFHVDSLRSQREASTWLDVLRLFGQSGPKIVQECYAKLDRMLAAVGSSSRAYVFGTGPSLDDLAGSDLEPGVRVVANSIVRNRDLMARIKPSIVCFGDPVFHAGCSSYAGEFRKLLLEAMNDFPIHAVIPLTHYAHYRELFPKELFDRIVGVPIRKLGAFNFDLRKNFAVQQTGNILTMMMLPVAATIADEICVAGCDGRPDRTQTYFWSHHAPSQIADKLDDAKLAHPGFFDISYTDYYAQHCAMLESLFSEGEREGKRFRSITTSYIPALKSRAIPSGAPAGPSARPLIYTFYSMLVGKAPEEERALLDLWKESWRAMGWEPLVLDESSVKIDAETAAMLLRFQELPSINKKNLDYCCYLRWLAVAQAGGGFMSDYDVINYDFEPRPAGVLTLYERSVPCLVSGTDGEFLRAARFFAAYAPSRDDRLNNRSHVSDMLILSKHRELFQIKPGCVEFGRPGWEAAPSVHFSNFSMKPHGYMPRHHHIPRLRPVEPRTGAASTATP